MVGTTGKRRVDQKDVQTGKGLGCSILQVQDFRVKTKQQQEKPTKPCLAPSPIPLPSLSPPFCHCGWEVFFSLCPALIPALPPLLSSPRPVILYSLPHPHCHMPRADTPGPLSKLHKPGSCTWSLFTLGPPVPCDESNTGVWTTAVFPFHLCCL